MYIELHIKSGFDSPPFSKKFYKISIKMLDIVRLLCYIKYTLYGGVPKWLKGAVLKTARSFIAARGFESHLLRAEMQKIKYIKKVKGELEV